MGRNDNKFLDLVKDKFKDSSGDFKKLSDDESIILQNIQINLLKLQPEIPLDIKPGDNKKIRANVIKWIITDSEASKYLALKGLTIKNATISGHLDLESQKINFPLTFRKCTFDEGVNLKLSDTKSLSFYRSNIHGCLNLDSAKIDGQLICEGAFIKNPGADAVIAENAIITRSVYFGTAIDEGIGEDDKLFEAYGGVKLNGIKIIGDLKCGGGKFKDKENRIAFSAQNASIEGDVLLNDCFEADGEVNLYRVEIKGRLDCYNASFNNPDRYAFIVQSAIINGTVYLNEGFKAKGEVNLLGTKIHGSLDCGSGEFNNLFGHAINCKKIIVERDVYFDKPISDKDGEKQPFKANGEVKLCGAQIGGELKCTGGIFNNPTGNDTHKCAFISKGLKVAAVFFDEGFEPIGEVNLINTRIEGPLILKRVKKNDHYKLNLKCTYVRSLEDDKTSWPEKGKLILDDFIYDSIEYDIHNHKDRVKWLGLNADEHSLQPYRQLANVLDNKGWEKEARGIRIAMNNQLRKETHKQKQRFWLYITGKLFGYGYKPFKVWKIALIIWFLGAIIYSYGNSYGLMQPPKDPTAKKDPTSSYNSEIKIYEHYPEFYAIPYSLDVFLPIVDLHQEAYWLPSRANKECNITCEPVYCLLISWMYFQIMAGWVLTTMLVGGLSGLIRNK